MTHNIRRFLLFVVLFASVHLLLDYFVWQEAVNYSGLILKSLLTAALYTWLTSKYGKRR
ncbi:MAG: hypothetical protein Q4D82_04290 [Neisseria sp.]|nr:hypothetical protein [Neisseria sp.]